MPVPLWDACPDARVVVLDPMARFLHLVESSWEERDSLAVPWDVRSLERADRINYLKGQMTAELQGRSVEAGEMEAMLARAEEGGKAPVPAVGPRSRSTSSVLRAGRGMQQYDGAAHPLGLSRIWRTVALAVDGGTSAYSEVVLPPAFQLFRVSDSHLPSVVAGDMDLQRVATIPLPQSLCPLTKGMRRPAGGATAQEGRVAFGVPANGSGPGR